MRLLLVLAASSFASSHAVAQGSSWDGGYVGVSGGVSGLAPATSATTNVQRVGRPDGNYTNTVYEAVDGNARIDREVSSESTSVFAAFAGITRDETGFVWGAEARLEVNSIERALAAGPIRWIPTGFSGRQATFPIPPNMPNGLNPSTGIRQENETVTSSLQIDHSLSLLGRFGVPIGDSFLLSATAGVTAAQAQLEMTQFSEQFGAYFYNLAVPNSPQLSVPITSSSTQRASSDETLWGATVGALAELKMATNWLVRADVTYTRYGEISVTNGAGSSTSFEPSTWSTSIGLAYRY